jgi:hypothetical protein
MAEAPGWGAVVDSAKVSMIRVFDEAGNVIETHEHKDDFKAF